MTLSLPEPDTSRLPRSPLELVVCQIRFENRLVVSESATAIAFHEALGGPEGQYPEVEEATSASGNVVIGPGGPTVSETAKLSGWRFRSGDGEWVVTLMPDHVALETTAYGTWADDFEPRLGAVISAAAEHVKPAFEQRIGLRYIDRITELELKNLTDWEEYIRPELLGAICHPDLGPAIRAAQQHLVVEIEEEVRANLRHGAVDDPEAETVDYLLDYDLYRQGGRRFDAEEVKATVAQFNTYALQLFHASITDKLLDYLRGNE